MSVVVLAWLVLVSGFTIIAIVATQRLIKRARRAVAAGHALPAIDIIRPCEGTDPGLEDNLLSTATAHYPAARHVFIAVPSTRDPAHAVALRVVTRAAELAPNVPVTIVVTEIDSEANRKAAQLARVYPSTTADVIVQADSDVRLDDRSLSALLAALLDDPRAGASYAPAVEVMPTTFADTCSAALLSCSPHALVTLAGLGEQAGGAPMVAGALLAHRREALDAIGGFHTLEPYLGEDFELGRRLHALGRTVRVSAEPARCTDGGLTLLEVVRRYARWILVVRRQRPTLMISYFLLLACMPMLVAATLVATLLGAPNTPLVLIALLAFVLLRGLLGLTARRAYSLPGGYFSALFSSLSGELTLFAASVLALGPSTIVWRGRHFFIGERGAMVPIAARPRP